MRRFAWPALALALVAVGYIGYQWQQYARAEEYFQAGVDKQFATEPNLESARNNFLSAIELRPRHARTRYYLGHVYAQLHLLPDARASFAEALRLGRGLDASQTADARLQLAALTGAGEPAPLTREPERVSSAPAPVPAPPAAAASPRPSAGVSARVTTTSREPASIAAGVSSAVSTISGVEKRGGFPYVPPAPDIVARIDELVARMFVPEREARISATTSLIVDAELAADAVPVALRTALGLQRKLPQEPAARAAAHSGIINTLVLLRSASPVSLRRYAEDIRRLNELARPTGPQTREIVDQVEARVAAALKQRPVAWIEIADERQRPLAEELARRLRAVGYDAPRAENVGERAPASRSEIRTQGNSDQALARWQARLMRELGLGEPKLTVLRKAAPKVDTYEIWFDRDLCVTRPLAGCAPVPN